MVFLNLFAIGRVARIAFLYPVVATSMCQVNSNVKMSG